MTTPKSGHVPESRQKLMAQSLMAERLSMPRRSPVDYTTSPNTTLTSSLPTLTTFDPFPPELGYIFERSGAWECPHTATQVTQCAGSLQPDEEERPPRSLPQDIDDFAFTRYVNTHFSKEEQLYPRSKPVAHPLLPKLTDREAREALAIFKLVLRYMGDSTLSPKQEQILGNYVVQKGISQAGLRDELYCQLVNQVFQQPEPLVAERGWVLLANCLGCFPPGTVLQNYLLKFVSDQAPRTYRAFLQHRALDCIHIPLPRPRLHLCLLEWKANQRSALMALEAEFTDNTKVKGHVTSFTTAEDFVGQLLKSRDVTSGWSGWSISLHRDGHRYDAAGQDYLLDLVSEIEIPPGFPNSDTYCFVHPDRFSHPTQNSYKNRAHDPLRPRCVELANDDLLTAVSPRMYEYEPLDDLLRDTLKHADVTQDALFDTRDEMLSSSVLNRRQGAVVAVPELSSGSALNKRYAARGRGGAEEQDSKRNSFMSSSVPSSRALSRNATKRDSAYGTSELGRDDIPKIFTSSFDENQIQSAVPNGNVNMLAVPGNEIEISSSSKLNSRYRKRSHLSPATSPHRPVTPSRYTPANNKNARRRSEHSRSGESIPEDMTSFVDKLFDPIVSSDSTDNLENAQALVMRMKGSKRREAERVEVDSEEREATFQQWCNSLLPDDATDHVTRPENEARALAARLKGGGQQLTQQYGQFQFSPTAVYPMSGGDLVMGGMQPYLNQMPPPMNGLGPEADIERQIRAKHIETQILEHNLYAERLRRQLQHQQLGGAAAVQLSAAQYQLQSPPLATFAMSSAMATPLSVQPAMIATPQTTGLQTVGLQGQSIEVDAKRPGGVRTFTRNFEHKQQRVYPAVTQSSHLKPPPTAAKPAVVKPTSPELVSEATLASTLDPFASTEPARKVSQVTFSEDVAQIPRGEETPVSSPRSRSSAEFSPPPPPPPPAQHGAAPTASPPLPPPTPPPAPVAQTIQPILAPEATPAAQPYVAPMAVTRHYDKKTIVDRKGEVKRVRVGRVEWPPRVEEVSKPEVEVGRLLIDESTEPPPQKIEGKPVVMAKKVEAPPKAPTPPPAQSAEPVHDIGMKTKQREVAQQLNAIHSRRQSKIEPPPPDLKVKESNTQTDAALLVGIAEHNDSDVTGQLSPGNATLRHVSTQTKEKPAVVETKRDSAFAPYIRPPTPQPEPSPSPVPSVDETEGRGVDLSVLENVRTALYERVLGPIYTYSDVPWRLNVRKEVFTPTERLRDPLLVELVFLQVVRDVFDDNCLTIDHDHKMALRRRLEQAKITPSSALTQVPSNQVKESVIDEARSWPYYFARLFPVHGGNANPGAHYLAVSHSGVRLLRRDFIHPRPEKLHVLTHYKLEDFAVDCVPALMARPNIVQLNLRGRVLLFTPHAASLCQLIEAYCIEATKPEPVTVKAVKDFLPMNEGLLDFRVNDIIFVDTKDRNLEKGWLYGTCHGKVGLFPAKLTLDMRRKLYKVPSHAASIQRGVPPPLLTRRTESLNSNVSPRQSLYEPVPSTPPRRDPSPPPKPFSDPADKYPLLEFAVLNFWESPFRIFEALASDEYEEQKQKSISDALQRRKGSGEWGADRQIQMVQCQKSAPQTPLLRYEDPKLVNEAVQLNNGLLQVLQSGAGAKGGTSEDADTDVPSHEIDAVLEAFHLLRDTPQLRDEAFCFLVKQTTDNSDQQQILLGLRLLVLMCAYYLPSPALEPYLRLSFNKVARQIVPEANIQDYSESCLRNLRLTKQIGGRRNVPGVPEIASLLAGRMQLAMDCSLGRSRAIKAEIHSATVAKDCLKEICTTLDITDENEMEEYVLFFEREDTNYDPIAQDEYIMDAYLQLKALDKQCNLYFARTTWLYDLHLGGNDMYLDMIYKQSQASYLSGNLCNPRMAKQQLFKQQAVLLAAMAIHADDQSIDKSVIKETLTRLVPTVMLNADKTSADKWVQMISNTYKAEEISETPLSECKQRYVDVLRKFPNFGSTFFVGKKVSGPDVKCDECKVTVSHDGVKILKRKTHSLLTHYTFANIHSTARKTDDKKRVFLVITHGKANHHKSTKIETDQASAVIALINQYERVNAKRQQGDQTNKAQ